MIAFDAIGMDAVATSGASAPSTASVFADLACSYAVRRAVSADLSAAYAVRARVQADLACAYAVLSGGGAPALTSVFADLACAYSVRSGVTRDLAFAYGVRARVSRDMACSYDVLAATIPSDGSTSPPITVPASRTAQFASRSRVIAFNSTAPVSVPKVPADELYYVGNMTADLGGSATTAASVTLIAVGVTLLEGPSIQGNLIVVKVGGFDTAPGAKNSFTFRVICANGEQFDRTLEFTQADDRSWTFGKDPDDKLLYALDVGADAGFGNSPLAFVQSPVVFGVTALSAPVRQGNLAVVKLGGLDVAAAAINSYGLTFLFANGEKIVRSIYFKQENH